MYQSDLGLPPDIHPCLPQEIWLHVGQYVPESDLRTLLGVNGAFFKLAMELRYRKITVEELGIKTMKMLQRLRSPGVAKYVRELTISVCCGFTDPTNYPGLPPETSFQKAVIEIIPGLYNVNSYSMHWKDDGYTVEEIVPLLTVAWTTFGSTLGKLSLRIPITPITLSTSFYFTALRDFSIYLPLLPDGQRTLTDTLAPFINKHARTLRAITVSCIQSRWDIGPLFCSLVYIPNLRQIKLQVDFETCGLSNPRGLTRILEEHGNHLKSVRLRPIPIRIWYSDWDVGEMAFGRWMRANISNPTVLRDMESLNLRTPCTPHDFELMVAYLQRSAKTLTKLTLAEYYLRYHQIETVVKIFSPEGILRNLSLEVMSISPELIDLLSTALPNLEVLKLEVQNISGRGEASHGFRDVLQMVNFKTEMEKRTYPNWKLYDIGIKKSGWDTLLLKTVAASVPSIQSFYGKGTMNIEPILR